MFVVTVLFSLKPDRAKAFLPLIQKNAARSLSDEPGCHQFDVCIDSDQPDTVFLYETYEDEAAFKTHMTMPHFLEFGEATDDMIAQKDVKTFQKIGD